jgi:glyoxylase-like metal-dependent hydrolase (beta-lactamase superfamily II)
MVEIIPGVHQVDGVNANSYLVWQEDGSLTLIDTGMSKDGRKIIDYIQTKLSKKLSDVKTIVLTHSHVDHVRGAYELKKATGAKIAIHELDADYLARKKKMTMPKGAAGFLFRILSPFFSFAPLEADQRLNEKDKIGTLAVVHTPGHTPGSISLYDEQKKLVFVGDTISYNKGKVEGPPKQFTLDVELAMKSIEKISHFDFEILLGGHGEPLISSNAAHKVKELCSSSSGEAKKKMNVMKMHF